MTEDPKPPNGDDQPVPGSARAAAEIAADVERKLSLRRLDGTPGKKRRGGNRARDRRGRLTVPNGKELHQYRLLAMYLRLGPRSDRLERTARKFHVPEKWLSAVALEYGWSEKAEDYDRRFEAALADLALRDHVAQTERDWIDIDKARAILISRMMRARPGTVGSVVRAMVHLMQYSRLIMGEPTSRKEVIDKADTVAIYMRVLALFRGGGQSGERGDDALAGDRGARTDSAGGGADESDAHGTGDG